MIPVGRSKSRDQTPAGSQITRTVHNFNALFLLLSEKGNLSTRLAHQYQADEETLGSFLVIWRRKGCPALKVPVIYPFADLLEW